LNSNPFKKYFIVFTYLQVHYSLAPQAFTVFDRDNSGKISKDELRSIVTGYGKMKLTEEDASEMLNSVDADGDGLIDYEVYLIV